MFSLSADADELLPVVVPCGHCIGCRLERSRQWAVRCMHEASLHEENAFITLTLAPEYLPVGGSLQKREFQLFMKRLRKANPLRKVRYFHCGEYGERLGRPHYHALLFGFDFSDKYLWRRRGGFPVWRSPTLEKIWPNGQSEIGSVTFDSAAYVARYAMKKVYGEMAWDHYRTLDLESGELLPVSPEYVTMSRRPGIGKPWLDKFMADVYPRDSVVTKGHEMKPPRYYDNLYELVDGPGALEVHRARRRARRAEDETPERLAVRETCAKARMALSERSLAP